MKRKMPFQEWFDQHDLADRPLIPAATVILLRDGDAGLETLMMRRNSRLSFAEGMWVFPGGKVDDDDGDTTTDQYDMALAAAVRECHEESSLVVDPSKLIYYSHWIPPIEAPKRFSTWFYITPSPEGQVIIDDGEITDHAWWSPRETLTLAQNKEIEILPPTWITLFDLHLFSSVDEAMRAISQREPRAYATRIIETDNGLAAIWEGDKNYENPIISSGNQRHRLVMAEPVWRFELGETPTGTDKQR